MSLVVAVDCSTTAAKAIVVDAAGSVHAEAARTFAFGSSHLGPPTAPKMTASAACALAMSSSEIALPCAS